MPRINPHLLAELTSRLGVRPARVYALIAAKAGELHLARHHAALALAAEHGININKRSLASEEDRAQLRAALSGRSNVPAPAVAVAQNPPHDIPRGRALKRPAKKRSAGPARKSNSVWVVHGRNLKPIEFSQAIRRTRTAAPYVGEILTAAFDEAAAVVVLLTPDDEARLKSIYVKPSDPAHERVLMGQARANVIFEAGRAFGSHPKSTVLLQIGNLKPFSDTAGVHVVHLSNNPESRRDLANRLEIAGCAIDISGTDWLSEGNFEPAPRRRK